MESEQPTTLNPGAASPPVPALFGFNQINGPVFPLPFENGILKKASAAMWSGQLRYPGGTVANYWFWPDASFINPCKGNAQPLPGSAAASQGAEDHDGTEAPHENEFGVAETKGSVDYDYSAKQAEIAGLGKHSFSLASFNKHFGSASPVTSPLGHVYDLNVLTATPEQIIEQLDVLKAESDNHSFPVRCIEFGNEFFMDSHYKAWFLNAHDYMAKITPGLLYARTLFPDAKLAVPCGMRFSRGRDDRFSNWNEQLTEHAALFDAVTIHEYTASVKSIDIDKYRPEHRRSVMAAWGDVALAKATAWARQFFSDKEVWITEWGFAKWEGLPLGHESLTESVFMDSAISGIFHASFLLKAIELSQVESCPITAMHRQVLNDVRGIDWGSNAGFVHCSRQEDGEWSAEINGPGQMFSHLAYIATACDQWLSVTVEGGGQLEIGTKLEGVQEVACIHAVAFANSQDENKPPVYALINRSNHPVMVRLPVSAGSACARLLRTVAYSHEDEPQYDGGSMPLWKLNGHFEHPWNEGPFSPAMNTTPLPEGEEWAVVEVGPISLNIIDVLPADDM